jgi:hypothetical protein
VGLYIRTITITPDNAVSLTWLLKQRLEYIVEQLCEGGIDG